METKDIQITYIGGGSRGWARGFMSDLALQNRISGVIKLYDIDFSSAKDNETIGNSISSQHENVSKWRYEASKDLKDALSGADIVIISILPGTFDEMQVDVHLPEKYGIFQSVGDSVGPGGIVRALRTIPMYVEIANAIQKYCPNTWVINYTNPMTICVRTLYKVFPKIKAFGCCHEVFGTQELLANIYNHFTGESITRNDVTVNVYGINHFTWIDKACYKGVDLFPMYEEFIKLNKDGVMEKNLNWMNRHFKSGQKVKFDLFKRYGHIAAAGDRHLVEFCPGKWYLGNGKNTLEEWGFALTSVDWRKQDLKEKLDTTNKLLKGEEKFELKETGEEGVNQICALLGLCEYVTNVNVPNIGQMPNIPHGAVVETNAYFSFDSIKPLINDSIPSGILNLIIKHVLNQEDIVEAGISGDYKKAFNVFLNDPNVQLSLADAKLLFDEMLLLTRLYLPFYSQYQK